MSNSRDILNALVNEDAIKAKKLIGEALLSKLGTALEEKLVDFAPTVFNEGRKPDFLDLDGDGDKKEPMVVAARQAKKKKEVAEETEVSDDVLIESFQNEVAQIVNDIQEETGEELTEDEIKEIAEEYLQILESVEEIDEEIDE